MAHKQGVSVQDYVLQVSRKRDETGMKDTPVDGEPDTIAVAQPH